MIDCKSWFNAGNTSDGVYTVNPDEKTPFEVRWPSNIQQHF